MDTIKIVFDFLVNNFMIFVLAGLFISAAHEGYVANKIGTGIWFIIPAIVFMGFGFGASIKGIVESFIK